VAVEVGTAYVSIIPSARGFTVNLGKELTAAGSAAGAEAGRATGFSFGKALAIGITGATVAAGAALTKLGVTASKFGLKAAAANEQAAISFRQFVGSADGALKMIVDLQQFAAETPFQFPELQDASRMLLVAGIAADKVLPMMRTLGDVVSSTGKGSEGLQRAAIAIQQMAASGKIYAEDLNQLRDAGIPVYELLQGATGKTKDEISDMVRAGTLGGKELEAVFDALATGKGLERFAGVMKQQSQTLVGLFSTLKDNVGLALARGLAPAVELIKAQMGPINDAVAVGMTDIAPILNRAIGDLVESAAKLIPLIAPTVGALGSAMVDGLSGVLAIIVDLAPALAEMAQLLADHVGGALTELIPDVGALLKAASPLLTIVVSLATAAADLLAPAFAALLKAATPLVAVLAAGLADAFTQLAELDLVPIFEPLTGVFVDLVKLAGPLVTIFLKFVNDAGAQLVDLVPILVDGFVQLAGSLGPVLQTFAVLLRDVAPYLLIILGDYLPIVVRLAEVLLPLWIAWEQMRALWLDLWLRLLVPFLPVLARLAEVLLPVMEKAIVPIVEALARFITAIAETKFGVIFLGIAVGALLLMKLAAWFVMSIVPAGNLLGLLQLIGIALVFIDGMRGMGALAEGTTGIQALSIYAQRAGAALMSAVTSTWLLTAAQSVLLVVMSPWFWIPALIIAVAAAFVVLYQDVEWFHKLVDDLWDSLQVGIEWLKELIGLLMAGDFTKAGEMVSAMASAIGEGLANLGTTIREKAAEWGKAFLDGLLSLANTVGAWLTDTLLPKLMEFGGMVARVVQWWWTQAIPWLIVGLTRIWAALGVWLYTTAIPFLIDAGINLVSAFVGWLKEAVPAALEALGGFLQSIGPWFTGTALPWLGERATALKDAFIAWASEAGPSVLASLGEWLSSLGGWIVGTAVPAVASFAGNLLRALLSWLGETGVPLLAGLGQLLFNFEVWLWGTAVPWLLRAGVALLGALLHFIQEAPGWIAAGLTWLLGSIGGWIATAAVWLAEKAGELAGALWGWLKDAAPAALVQLGEWLAALGGWITGTALPAIGEKAAELASALWGWIKEAVPKALVALGRFLQSIGVWIAEEGVPLLLRKGAELLLTLLLWIPKLAIEAPILLNKFALSIVGWIATAAVWLAAKAWDLFTALWSWLLRLPLLIPELLAKGLVAIGGWIIKAVPWLIGKAVELQTAILSWIDDAIRAAPAKLLGLALGLAHWIEYTAVPWLKDKAAALMAAIVNWISDAKDAAPGLLEGWAASILQFVHELPGKIADAAKNMWLGMTNAFITAINWMIRTWNDFGFDVPSVTIMGVEIGGFKFESPNVDELPLLAGFAKGGRPPTDRPSLVGERGPEMFWPDRAGTVIPNDAMGSGLWPAAGGAGLSIGHLEVTGQDRPADTAWEISNELRWLSMAGAGA
jgi:tape measure domain-containing protein